MAVLRVPIKGDHSNSSRLSGYLLSRVGLVYSERMFITYVRVSMYKTGMGCITSFIRRCQIILQSQKNLISSLCENFHFLYQLETQCFCLSVFVTPLAPLIHGALSFACHLDYSYTGAWQTSLPVWAFGMPATGISHHLDTLFLHV